MKKESYIDRRELLASCIENDSVLVLFSGLAPQRSADYPYVFTPYRPFYYLTGIDREDAILVMVKKKGKVNTFLFIEKPDEKIEKWTGIRMKPDEAKNISGIESIFFSEDFKDYFNRIFGGQEIKNIYMSIEHMDSKGIGNYNYQKSIEILKRYPSLNLINVLHIIGKMRTIKSDEEITAIEKAVKITQVGLTEMLKNLKPNLKEYELESEFDYVVRKNGCTGFSFKTIVASGKNGTILHYESNRDEMKDGDLVLIDLGAEKNYYCGDLTRTFPVNGKYSKRQKQIYDIVLEAQRKVIEAIVPGIPFSSLNDIVKAVYEERLMEIGLIDKKEELQKYYFHGVSHHLGLDTHDVCEYDINLKAGMVITVEPGLYISEESIGIRIEDDVLVTEDGCRVLSNDMIRTTEEIEAFMENNK